MSGDEKEKVNQAVREARASWQDEHGIRGPQPNPPISTGSVTGGSGGGDVRREPKQPPFPADPSTGAAENDATNIDVYGAQNAAPALLHILQTAPPTVPPP